MSSHLIHPPPSPSHPFATNPPVQIHTTHTQQSTNILTPLGLGYDIIHALSSHPFIHLLDQVTPLQPTLKATTAVTFAAAAAATSAKPLLLAGVGRKAVWSPPAMGAVCGWAF